MKKIETELRALWKDVHTEQEPQRHMPPHTSEDIEEFLDAGEWGLALEHICDWAAATKKTKAVAMMIKAVSAVFISLPVV